MASVHSGDCTLIGIIVFSFEGTSLTEHSRALQLRLLKLVLALIKLEHYVDSYKSEAADSNTASSAVKEGNGCTLDASYSPGYLIPHQPLFYRAVGSALSLKVGLGGSLTLDPTNSNSALSGPQSHNSTYHNTRL